LKIAIACDWLSSYNGAERCIESFVNLYPDSQLYTLVDFLQNRDFIQNKSTHTSFIQNLPLARKYFRYYLPLFPYAIENFDLSRYDIILSSSHSVAKNILTHSLQTHVCYCHTPMRYAWDLYFEYINQTNPLVKNILKLVLHKIRIWDVVGANRVDYFIANSHFISNRIKKIYNKPSKVIYPPVDVDKFEYCDKKEDYYITVSRLVPYKRVDLIIQAFNQTNKKLIVVGQGEMLDELKSIANSNIEFSGYVPHKQMVQLLKKAKGFVFAALEDFGISVVEALACATPVIALNKGGTKESVIPSVGVLFDKQDPQDLLDAINRFEKIEWDYPHIRNYALSFDRKVFEAKIKEFIDNISYTTSS